MSESHRLTSWARCMRALFLLSFLAAAGCSFHPIYSTTGMVMTDFAWDESTPYIFTLDDPDMACTLGTSLNPFVYSFSRVTDEPLRTGSLLMLLSGNCSEEQAWEAQLRSLRAEQQGNVKEAQDARTEAKRLYGLTAQRRLVSYQRAMQAYDYDPNDPDQGCPYFDSDQDELAFLLGNLTGLQAVMNDAASGVQAGVPRDIAAHAEKAARCLSNRKWAGLPDAIRAAVWLLIPDTKPAGSKGPWETLAEGRRLGIEKGMRAANALEIVVAENMGREDVLAASLQAFADSEAKFKVWKDYQLVDKVARNTALAVSDRYWTQHYGERTPALKFGQLKKTSDQPKGLGDLL